MLPALTKHWQFRVNLDPGRSGNREVDCARAFITMKQALTSFDVPWVVERSSNGRECGYGDFVKTDEDVVAGFLGHEQTWVVMSHPKLRGHYLFSFGDTLSATRLNVVWSPGSQFLGGTTKASPEASDMVSMMVGGEWLGRVHPDGAPVRVHAMCSDDGCATRVVLTSTGRVTSLFVFDSPADATPGWSTPTVGLATTEPTLDDLLMSMHDAAVAFGPAGRMNLQVTAEGWVEGEAGNVYVQVIGYDATMPDDGYHSLTPVGLYHHEVVGQRGHHGHLNDVWWTSAAVRTGSTFPDDGTKQFAVFGNLVLPWNGQRVELG